MDPNGKLFEAKLEVPRSRVEREDQRRTSEHIVLCWSEQSKDNQIIAE